MESEVIITSDIEPDTSLEMDTEEIIPKDNATIADDKKNLGNEEYKVKNYKTAIQYYSDAIKLCPDIAAYYGNRAACYMMLEDYNSAFSDARASVQLDEKFTKGYIRMVKCCLLMGDLINAEQAIKKIIEIDPNSNAVNTEKQNYQQLRQYEDKIKLNYDKKIYRTCVYFLDAALRISPACLKYKLLKAECLAYLGRTAESSDIAITIMQMYPTSADAIYIRGLCLYYSDNLEKSVLHFERALQLDPDHIKAKELRIKSKQLKDKKEAGNLLFKNNRFREAHTIYTAALGIDGTNKEVNSKLYYNRALVNSKMGNLREAINDCTSVLEINNQYLKALLLRARCNNDLSRYDECVKDYESAYKMSNTNDIKHLLREAKLALKKSKRKDYYKILGITKNANDEQIKKGYRKKALLYHPDRHADSSDANKKEQEIKFKEVSEAYTVLSDPAKKMRYDSGQDIEDDQQEFDPNQLYRHFFQFSDNMNGFNFQF